MKMIINFFFTCFIACSFTANSFAVMPTEHYEKLIEKSEIKAVAVVESIKVLERKWRHNFKEAVFRLETNLGQSKAPEKFKGTFHAADHFWQDPGVGGIKYIYPNAGEKVYVTISRNGGNITGYTVLTPEIKKSLLDAPYKTNRWYAFFLKGKPAGYFHVRGNHTPGETAPVFFEHQFVIRFKGKATDLRMKTYSKDNSFFTPVKIISQVKGEGVKPFEAVYSEGRFAIRSEGKSLTLEVPDRLATDYILFEIVRNLPFNKEKVFEFNLLEASELNLKKNHKIEYKGIEKKTIAARKNLHHFMESGQGSSPAHYWVDENHNLIRVTWDNGGKEFLLSSENEAKNIVMR